MIKSQTIPSHQEEYQNDIIKTKINIVSSKTVNQIKEEIRNWIKQESYNKTNSTMKLIGFRHT